MRLVAEARREDSEFSYCGGHSGRAKCRGESGSDAGLGNSFSHAARATGVAIMVSNSIGVKRPSAA